MAPRSYQSDKRVVPIKQPPRTPKKLPASLLGLPLEPWEDSQFWHSAKDASAILQKHCGKEGFSYESLLEALENEYINGFHWFKRGGTYKLNIWRMIKYPPATLDL